MRWLLKAPVPAFQAGFGWIFARRLLMLSHTGRSTGSLHRTVVEVVSDDRHTRESIVAAGWGTETGWYRNIQANPAVEVRIGHDRYVPVQRFLGEAEAVEVLDAYVQRHRLAARFVMRWLGFEWNEAGRHEFYRSVRLVGFRPK